MNRVPLLSLGLCGLLLIAGAKTAFSPNSGDNSHLQPKPLVSQPVQNDSKSAVFSSRAPKLKPNETSESGSLNELRTDNPGNASNSGGERVTNKDKNVERVYYCGAPTKKGTPCSRRVKTNGYCWQHKKEANR